MLVKNLYRICPIINTSVFLSIKTRHRLKQLIMNHLAQHIESLIFVSESPVTRKELKSCLEETFAAEVHHTDLDLGLTQVIDKYKSEIYSFEIAEISGGYQFLTKGAYHNTVGTYLKQKNKRKLSKSAMETLAIIAYKQPVTKSEIEKIRGVSCDYTIQKLLEKELVAIAGRSEVPGRPLLYVTSDRFMNYFGINSIKDLPKLKEFKPADSEIGTDNTIDTPNASSDS